MHNPELALAAAPSRGVVVPLAAWGFVLVLTHEVGGFAEVGGVDGGVQSGGGAVGEDAVLDLDHVPEPGGLEKVVVPQLAPGLPARVCPWG